MHALLTNWLNYLSLSPRFNGHLGYQLNLGKPVFIETKDDGSGGDNWSYKSCKPTPSFYRPDALPVAQPTVSKH